MFDLNFARESFGQILAAAPLTILVAVVATLAGLILAILVAIARERKIPLLSPLLSVVV